MLGQRTAALHGLPRTDVGHRGPGDAANVDPGVGLELAVLDRLQPRDEQLRHVADADQAAVLVVQRIDGRDLGRVQAHQVEVAGGERGHGSG